MNGDFWGIRTFYVKPMCLLIGQILEKIGLLFMPITCHTDGFSSLVFGEILSAELFHHLSWKLIEAAAMTTTTTTYFGVKPSRTLESSRRSKQIKTLEILFERLIQSN